MASDDEWEYEYYTSLTEDVYITLDLTTHIAPTFTRDKRKTPKSTARASNKSLNNVLGSKDQSLATGEDGADLLANGPVLALRKLEVAFLRSCGVAELVLPVAFVLGTFKPS